MKNHYWLRAIVLASFILFSFISKAQQAATMDSLLSKAFSTDQLLPMLIDSAIKNSPEIKRYSNAIDVAEASLAVNKKDIYNALSLTSSYGYGTNISAANNAGVGAGTFVTTSQTGAYYAGVSVNIPIVKLLNRKSVIKSGKAQINMATADKENTALDIKQEVIRLYQALKLSQKLLTISGQNKQNSFVSYSMAEKGFLQGQVTIEQFSTVSQNYNKSVLEYESNTNSFQTNYFLLESFVGVNLYKLISQVK